MAERVHGDESTDSEMWRCRSNRPEHEIADCGGEYVLRPSLNHAWFVRVQSRQQRTEIQVVSENDQAIRRGEIEDLGISRVCPTDS